MYILNHAGNMQYRRCTNVSVGMRLIYQRTLVQFPNSPAWMRGMCNSTSRTLNVVFRHLLALQAVLLRDVCKQNLLTYNENYMYENKGNKNWRAR